MAALLADATDNVLVSELGPAESRRRTPTRFVAGPASGKLPNLVVLDAVEVVKSKAEKAPDAVPAAVIGPHKKRRHSRTAICPPAAAAAVFIASAFAPRSYSH